MRLRDTRRRLTLAFGGAFAVLLLLGAAALYVVLERGYRHAYDQALLETRQLAHDLFRFDRGEYPTAAATIAHIMSEMVTSDRSMVAFDSTGQRIATARRAPMAPDLSHVAPLGVGASPSSMRAAGHEVRLMRVSLPEGFELVVGVSDVEYLARRHTLRVALGIGVPILLLLGALLGARLAEPVLQVQRAFLADAAHELRTPIAIVLSKADAARQGDDPARARAALDAVAGEAQRMGTMVADLLLLAREDAETTTLRVPLFLDDVAQRAIERARALPEAHGRPIVLGAWDEAPALGDPVLLERAILALLHNALVHASDGPVTLECGTDDRDVWLRVSDTGPGIAPADRERVFERGTRLDTGRPGHGLGLAIVRTIAERMGGRVAVSDHGTGASLMLTLPSRPIVASPAPSPELAR